MIFKIGGSLGLLTGMRLITGLELLFWFLAMITRICFKFEGKEKQKNKITSTENELAAVPCQTKLCTDFSEIHIFIRILLLVSNFGCLILRNVNIYI